jgi:pimeloyl-ACP methyl ester carboxylesterase
MRNTVAAILALAPLSVLGAQAHATKPGIVLVHGAFADASGWSDVIDRLQKRGYNVVAVQNPLSSLATDVETTKRLVDAQPGDVVLVGHSYGGAVISGASAGDSKVKALVYISAFAPDANEPVGAIGAKYPAAPLNSSLVVDKAGFAYIDTARFHAVFAADLPLAKTRIMAVTQKPLSTSVFGQSNSGAGWRTIPSWFLVAKQDQAINPDVERFYAKRAKSETHEIESSHVSFLSHPDVVTQLIVDAAVAVTPK